MRPYQFCNLSEVVVRSTDSISDIAEKVKIATVIGTIQATMTHFPYLRKIWKTNTEEENLLGVSLTGILDNKMMTEDGDYLKAQLTYLKEVSIETNKELAEKLGIKPSTATSCIKPSGTVSQLVDSASGIHARHSEYYIRTVRGDNKDPLTQFMISQGVPNEPDVMKPDQTTVFSFPQKSPEGAVTRHDMTALEHLELWLTYQRYWCEHKPSITVSVKDEEWLKVGAWVYDHFDEVSGVSFLPFSDHTYQQAPYQEVSKREYEDLLSVMPKQIDWESLSDFEKEDTSKGSSTFACVGGVCELVDIGA